MEFFLYQAIRMKNTFFCTKDTILTCILQMQPLPHPQPDQMGLASQT